MSVLWTSADAARATNGRVTRDWQAGGVSIDTRTLRPGDLFVALQDQRDGHDFVASALEKGAAAALVSRIPEGLAPDAPLLIVPDVLDALQALGRAARARMQGKVLAVTGSVGKTSTKEMARLALTGQGRVHAAEASYNNHWGVPLTLARMPADTDFAVLELGMNHAGEIRPLTKLARPHVALITTVAAAHLEAFGSIDDIAREKSEIFSGLLPAGTAVLPEDLPVTAILRDAADAAEAVVIGFGEHGAARLISADLDGDSLKIRAKVGGRNIEYSLQTLGRHFAMNSVGVLAALAALGADLPAAASALQAWQPPKGRGAVEDLDGLRLIDDAYNSNPTSLSAGLATLARLTGGRRVAILGDMLELGPDELSMHRDIALDPAIAAIDLIHLAGPRMQALHQALPPAKRGLWAISALDLAGRASELVQTGDIVLVKGSNSSKVSTVVDALRDLRQSSAPDHRG